MAATSDIAVQEKAPESSADVLAQSTSASSQSSEESMKKTTETVEMIESVPQSVPPETYRLYRGRFTGIVALVSLNLVAAMSWPWFGPISNDTAAEFHISLDQVNWLGNIVALIYLPTALLIPTIISRYGIRRCCDLGAMALILSAWIRYAGTARSLTPGGAYALLIVGQFFASIAQPIYQVIGPKFSETWFNLNGRTTATMIVGISNPVGGALGQLISPLVGSPRQSVLVLGILSTAVVPFVFLIQKAPPTPPTFAASQKPASLLSLCRAMLGLPVEPAAYMSRRERFDFAIVTCVFGVLVASSNGFAILSAQILQPAGYSSDESGFLGACMLLTGMVSAIISAPLFDRVFTHHLALTSKCLVPVVALGWLSLIWAVRPHNLAALFVIMTVIGVCSVTMLAVGMELGCELTRVADGSSAILWFTGNLFTVASILIAGALRAGPGDSPPLHMKRFLIFQGVVDVVVCSSIFFLRGFQRRKMVDEQKNEESQPVPPATS